MKTSPTKEEEEKEEVFIDIEYNTSKVSLEKKESHKEEEFLEVNVSDDSEKPAEENDCGLEKNINFLSCAKGDIKNKKKQTVTCLVTKEKIRMHYPLDLILILQKIQKLMINALM